MPQSKKRKHHHEHHQSPNAEKAKKNKSAVLVAVIFFCLLGIGITYFAAGPGLLWILTGAVVGAIAGYFFGLQIDKALAKK
jgi:uncharacterized membrane protein YqgA involved in biofilm formation